MRITRSHVRVALSGASLSVAVGCRVPAVVPDPVAIPMPTAFSGNASGGPTGGASGAAAVGGRIDSTGIGAIGWKRFFEDSTLVALIDTAVQRNPELLMTLKEVEMARNEVQAIDGRLLPRVFGTASLGVDKSPRYTAEGAGNASTDMEPGTKVPDPLPDISLGFMAGWEVDIRGKIRSQKGAALSRYLGTMEGNRFVMTGLVAEVANTYYELTALDAKLAIIRQTVELQRNELEVVRTQKQAAVVSELAVKQFEALLLNSQAMEFEVLQQIREAENRMNLLLGRYPQPVARSASRPMFERSQALDQGLPSQLLHNRPDIRQAELELAASRFDVKAARAEFYPEVNLAAGLGIRAFKPSYLFTIPESMAFSLVGDMMAPLFNRKSITAELGRATAYQQKALIQYQQTVLHGFTEVTNLVSAIGNLDRVYSYKAQQAAALDTAISVSRDLFTSARANYLEVLTAQREAIDIKLELVETRLRQRVALTNLYRALGGGWQ
ncbi:MAG: efflux transporter outer membrane subunit [Gemmatimonadaceae bacterium]|jgi:NodT family efflux transporter outer membrane factor (OMF) lipoprotein